MKPAVLLVAALVAVGDALPDNFGLERLLRHRRRNIDVIHDLQRASRTPRAAIGARYKTAPQSPAVPATLNAVTSQGCFKSSGNLTSEGTPEWNSSGSCATLCKDKGYAVSATTAGTQCFCGNLYPPKGDIVADKNCNVACGGYDLEACES